MRYCLYRSIAQAIETMGDKAKARKAMIEAGVPVVPGSKDIIKDEETAAVTLRKLSGIPF